MKKIKIIICFIMSIAIISSINVFINVNDSSARGPAVGCKDEQCCYDQRQECFDAGRNNCDEQYDKCVANLPD